MRKSAVASLLAFVFFATLAQAGTQAPRRGTGGASVSRGTSHSAPGSESGWRKTAGEFSAMLLLTLRPEDFLAEWSQPQAADFTPEFETTTVVRRGDLIAGMVLFSGCQEDEEGRCRTVAQFVVTDPNGDEYARTERLELYRGESSASTTLSLGRAYFGLVPEPQDPIGRYRMTTLVCDEVAQSCVELEQSFETLRRMKDFELEEFMGTYYLDPRPEMILKAIDALSRTGAFQHPAAIPPALGFFSEVFSLYPGRAEEFKEAISSQPELVKDVLMRAFTASGQPNAFVTKLEVSAAKGDRLWGAYFASGQTMYLDAIFELMLLVNQRENRALYLAGAGATWSVASNLRRHVRVKQHVFERLQSAEEPLASALNKVLTTSLDELQTEVAQVVRQMSVPEGEQTDQE